MKFIISREALLKPLQVVSGVVEKRQTLPILSNVLLELENNVLTLTGTDLEVELKATVGVNDAEAGETTLPARKFMDICRTLPEEAMIDITLDGERAIIRSGKSRFTLSTLPATEYPSTEAINSPFDLELSQKELKTLIDQTQFCMANQDVRYYLNGLLLELRGGEIRTVATDGHRLALCQLDKTVEMHEDKQVIVPRKGVVELAKLLEEKDDTCTLQIGSNHIKVTLDGVIMSSKLIDGRFPDYERVIPASGSNVILADRNQLRQALVRTSILSNEKYRGIRLQLESGRVRATVNNPEQEEAEEELDVQYEGDSFEIGFNVSYLLDALNVVKQDQVRVEMTDSNSSCIIRGVDDEQAKYVVMPMRL